MTAYIYLIRFKSDSYDDVVKVGRTADWRRRVGALHLEYQRKYSEIAEIADFFIKEVDNVKAAEDALILSASQKFQTDITANARRREWMRGGTARKLRNLGRKNGMSQVVRMPFGLCRWRWQVLMS